MVCIPRSAVLFHLQQQVSSISFVILHPVFWLSHTWVRLSDHNGRTLKYISFPDEDAAPSVKEEKYGSLVTIPLPHSHQDSSTSPSHHDGKPHHPLVSFSIDSSIFFATTIIDTWLWSERLELWKWRSIYSFPTNDERGNVPPSIAE